MQNRRDFLKQSSILLAGSLVAPQLMASSGLNGNSAKNIGIQLYSLRDMVNKQGIQTVLEAVAKIGYKNLETLEILRVAAINSRSTNSTRSNRRFHSSSIS